MLTDQPSESFFCEKRCLGWYCDLRNECKLYYGGSGTLKHWFQPEFVSDNCYYFRDAKCDSED